MYMYIYVCTLNIYRSYAEPPTSERPVETQEHSKGPPTIHQDTRSTPVFQTSSYVSSTKVDFWSHWTCGHPGLFMGGKCALRLGPAAILESCIAPCRENVPGAWNPAFGRVRCVRPDLRDLQFAMLEFSPA